MNKVNLYELYDRNTYCGMYTSKQLREMLQVKMQPEKVTYYMQ